MSILSVLAGLFGCAKAPDHTADDIASLSISCGHMNYYHTYSFTLAKSEEAWLLSAGCFTDEEHPRVEFENLPVTAEDADRLLAIVREQDLIDSLRRYKAPKLKWHLLDETTYYASIRFADGATVGGAVLISKEMESCFYRLAEKYGRTKSADKMMSAEITGDNKKEKLTYA